jgi:hypothetical protein
VCPDRRAGVVGCALGRAGHASAASVSSTRNGFASACRPDESSRRTPSALTASPRCCHAALLSRRAAVTSRCCHVALLSRRAAVTSRCCHVALLSRRVLVSRRVGTPRCARVSASWSPTVCPGPAGLGRTVCSSRRAGGAPCAGVPPGWARTVCSCLAGLGAHRRPVTRRAGVPRCALVPPRRRLPARWTCLGRLVVPLRDRGARKRFVMLYHCPDRDAGARSGSVCPGHRAAELACALIAAPGSLGVLSGGPVTPRGVGQRTRTGSASAHRFCVRLPPR